MSETPLVSICCITYNHASFIRQCLDGFLMQKTSFPFEILIHDDASTDRTADIIREYQAKYPEIIKPILQKENQFSKGINVGVKYNFPRACGKYIALCEGDDYWTDPEKLQIQFDYMEKHPECSLCFHNVDILDQNTSHFEAQHLEEGDFTFTVERWIPFHTCSLFFRNKEDRMRYLIKVITEGSKKIKGGDLFIVGVMLQYGTMHCLTRNMAVYRLHDGGLTQNADWQENQIKWMQHWVYFYKIFPSGRLWARKHMVWLIKDEFFRIFRKKNSLLPVFYREIRDSLGYSRVVYLTVCSILSAFYNAFLMLIGKHKKRVW